MEVQKETIIKVSSEEIIKDILCHYYNLTFQEFKDKYGEKPSNYMEIYWDIEERGDVDRGNYRRDVKSIKITIKE